MNPAWTAIEQGWADRERRGELLIRGHSLGYCIRRQVLGQLDMPTKPYPGKLATAMDASSAFEDVVVGWLRDLKWMVEDQQRPFTIDVLPGRAFVALHPDGICFPKVRPWAHVLEVKSFGQTLYGKYVLHGLGAFPEYQWQLSAEMHATGMPALLAVALKGGDEGHLILKYVTTPPRRMAEIKERVGDIERTYIACRDNPVIPPNDLLMCEPGARSWGCPYYHLGKCPQSEVPELTGEEGARLEQMARWLDNAIKRKHQAEADERKWRDGLLAELTTAGLSKAVTKNRVISVQHGGESKRLDSPKLRRVEPDLYERLMKEYGATSTRRDTVRVAPRERAEGDGDKDTGTEGRATS